MKMRQEADCAELIRACNYKNIRLEDMDIDGFKGACLIRSRSEGAVELKNISCNSDLEADVLQTTEDFVLGWM